jgi:hypothetical protein
MKRHKIGRKTKYETSLARTRAVRGNVTAALLPLFDHLLDLAESAHRHSKEPGRGYLAKRAGVNLLAARRLAQKHLR